MATRSTSEIITSITQNPVTGICVSPGRKVIRIVNLPADPELLVHPFKLSGKCLFVDKLATETFLDGRLLVCVCRISPQRSFFIVSDGITCGTYQIFPGTAFNSYRMARGDKDTKGFNAVLAFGFTTQIVQAILRTRYRNNFCSENGINKTVESILPPVDVPTTLTPWTYVMNHDYASLVERLYRLGDQQIPGLGLVSAPGTIQSLIDDDGEDDDGEDENYLARTTSSATQATSLTVMEQGVPPHAPPQALASAADVVALVSRLSPDGLETDEQPRW